MKLFYSGPVTNTELLLVMLEKHGIIGTHEFESPEGSEDDLNRLARVYVPDEQFDRACQLFYSEREDEL